jgi:hypothetical protein
VQVEIFSLLLGNSRHIRPDNSLAVSFPLG